MPTLTIELTEESEEILSKVLKSGAFTDASEAMQEGLRLLDMRQAAIDEEEEVKAAYLRKLLAESTASYERGDYIEINTDEELEAVMEEIFQKAVAKSQSA